MFGNLKVGSSYKTLLAHLNSNCNDLCPTTCSSFSTFKDSGCEPSCPWEEDTHLSINCGAGWCLLLVMHSLCSYFLIIVYNFNYFFRFTTEVSSPRTTAAQTTASPITTEQGMIIITYLSYIYR